MFPTPNLLKLSCISKGPTNPQATSNNGNHPLFLSLGCPWDFFLQEMVRWGSDGYTTSGNSSSHPLCWLCTVFSIIFSSYLRGRTMPFFSGKYVELELGLWGVSCFQRASWRAVGAIPQALVLCSHSSALVELELGLWGVCSSCLQKTSEDLCSAVLQASTS